MPKLDWRGCLGPLAAACALAGTTGIGSGADPGAALSPMPEERRETPRWTLSFTPYSWLTALNGETTAKGRTTDIDADAFEVLRHLDGVPWMSYAEARNGPLALYSDIIYAPLRVSASRTGSFDGLSLDATLGVDIRETIIEAGAVYEVGKWRLFSGSTAVDLLAGARYWRQDVEINLALTATLGTTGLALSGGRAIARSGAVEWVDPLVGLRVRHELAPGQELLVRGDVGGFDAGSQFSWNVLAAYSFQMGVYHGLTYSGILGYRALSVDFEKGSGVGRFEYDVVQHGPLLGLTLSF